MNTLETQLMDAVRETKIDEVISLIEKGCKVDVGDVNNMTPLHLAAVRDHTEIAELLIERGANVNSKTTDKMAPLHYAAARGFPDMVAVLLHGGASIDSLDASDRTPLMLAVTRGHVETVELLITYGAKINIEEIHGYTPLCEAVGNKSVEIARLLLRSGAKQTQSKFLLHYTVLHRHLEMAELLLKYGAYPNLRDERGDTPLLLAITCRHMDMIKLLLQYEANPNYASSVSAVTPLLKALHVQSKHDRQGEQFEDILKLLCLYNVDLNPAGNGTTTTTPLATAIMSRQKECAAWLIRAGANVNMNDENIYMAAQKTRTILDLALRKHDPDLVYLIVAAGFDMSRYTVATPKDFSKVNTDSLSGWLTYMKFNPRRLVDLCRLKIRSQMGCKILHLVPTLDIPQSLKQFLLFQEIQMNRFSDNDLVGLLQPP